MTLLRVSILAALADQASKYLIVRYCRMNESVPLIRDYLYLTYIQNPGAAFGFMANTQAVFRIPFFILITFGAGLIVYSYQRFIPAEKIWTRFALGLIWGGAMGNFIDRVFYRKVVDFIDVRYHQYQWYVFNVADSCITVGLILLVMGYLLEKPAKKMGGS
jgi:signal peptidase II